MLDGQTEAAAAVPAAQETVSAPSNEPVTQDTLANLFEAELKAERGEEEKPAAAPQEEAAAEAETEAPEAEVAQEEANPESGAETPTAERTHGGLQGMSEADKAEFAKLPPALQSFMTKRITEQQADYTRKTQAVAEQRKIYDAGVQHVAQQLQQYDDILSKFTAPQLQPPHPGLRHQDPEAFEQQMAVYTHNKHLQELAAAEQAKAREEQGRLQQEQAQAFYREQSQALREMAPELADGEKGARLRKGVFEYAVTQGYTQEQLNMASARDMVTLWKAQRFDAVEKAKSAAKPVAPKAPKAASPGPAKAVGRPSSLTHAVRQLSENPSRAALAAAYAAELASEK